MLNPDPGIEYCCSLEMNRGQNNCVVTVTNGRTTNSEDAKDNISYLLLLNAYKVVDTCMLSSFYFANGVVTGKGRNKRTQTYQKYHTEQF